MQKIKLIEDELYTNGQIAVHLVHVVRGLAYCKLHGGMRVSFPVHYFAKTFRQVWCSK